MNTPDNDAIQFDELSENAKEALRIAATPNKLRA